jgi:CAAX protease family protein
MMETTAETPRFRFRLVPTLVVIVLGLGLPILAAMLAQTTIAGLHLPVTPGDNPPWLFVHHTYQLALALIAIAVMKRFVPADYGLHRPRGKSYFGAAIAWGLFFGVLMTVVDYFPQLLAHTIPKLDYPLTTPNVLGWLGFEGIYVGPTEEIPYRALLVTYLAATMPGRVRLFGFTMNAAGIVVALIFALAHAASFATETWPLALGQQLYAFALGVFYAYWLEKSRSVVAPAIGHNVSDVTEFALLFAWIAWGAALHL